ncbi:MAG: phosphatidate cytidylyltransferase [Bryobacteraceae bacterium]
MLTAALLIPIVLAVIFKAPEWAMRAVLTALGVAGFVEFRRLAAKHECEPHLALGIAAGLALMWLPRLHWEAAATLMLAGMAWAMRRDLRGVLPRSSALALGVVYCFAPWLCALYLHRFSPYVLLFAVSINWVGDAAAFAVGSMIGKNKLAPAISPGKSWEGAAGSMIACCAYGVALLTGFSLIGWQHALVVSAAANVAGQLGDLAESAMKRGAGVKDSGSMLPGHGGWLDRLDSTLFTLPVVYLWFASS